MIQVVIWGTGKLYNKYRNFLLQFNVVCLCDNNPEKQGTHVDGIEVVEPALLETFDFDYVVVMAYKRKEICLQIRKMNIPENKIVLESQLCRLRQPQMCVHAVCSEKSLDDWCTENENSILLISHNYSYTGIPVALKNMAGVLKRLGYKVLMAAMEGGAFVQELKFQGIDYIDDLAICYQAQCFQEVLERFKVVVIGSFSLYDLAVELGKIRTPVLWWIHETSEKYYAGKKQLPVKNNMKFLAGGNRVKRIFNNHYEGVKIENLQYCIPDFDKHELHEIIRKNQNDNMIIAIVGTIDQRKAQDVLLEAVIKMPLDKRNKIKVILVGRLDENDAVYAKKIDRQKQQLGNVEWINEMSQERLEVFYETLDVLVCPSRDDPMPIVVTQAMMHEKTCIISDAVGHAEFIEHQENGFVFPNGDSEALMEILVWLVNNKAQCALIGTKSRKIYDEEFSERVMEKRLKGILHELCSLQNR